MRSLMRSETRKLTTTRTSLWLLSGMVLLAGPGILLAGQSEITELSKPLHEQIWFLIAAGFTRLLVVVLGIRSVTDEVRFGTIVPTSLTEPRRWRTLGAKTLTVGAAGMAMTVISEIAMVGSALALIGSKGAEFTITNETVSALVGMALAGGLWAVIGVAIGALVRNQVMAIVGSLLWLMPGGGIEDLVKSRLGDAGDYLPGNMGMALSLAPDEAPFAVVLAVLVLYAAAATWGAMWVSSRRDI